MAESTANAPGRYSSPSTYPATYGYRVDDGDAIGNISSFFTDETAQAEITVCNTTVNSTYASMCTDFAGVGGATAAKFEASVMSTNIGNLLSTAYNHATSGIYFDFNEAASSACKKLNLYYTALCNVGILTST